MAKYKGSHKRRYTDTRPKGKGSSAKPPVRGITLKKLGQKLRRAMFR